jgi:hypothetical protein
MEIKVKLENKEIVVSKLPIKKYADLLKKLDKLPGYLSVFEKSSTDEFLEQLPGIILGSLSDFIGIVVVATDLTEEEVEELGLSEITDIIFAVIEANRYKDIIDKVKKAMAQVKVDKVEKKQQ